MFSPSINKSHFSKFLLYLDIYLNKYISKIKVILAGFDVLFQKKVKRQKKKQTQPKKKMRILEKLNLNFCFPWTNYLKKRPSKPARI